MLRLVGGKGSDLSCDSRAWVIPPSSHRASRKASAADSDCPRRGQVHDDRRAISSTGRCGVVRVSKRSTPRHKDISRRVGHEILPMSRMKQSLKMLHPQCTRAVKLCSPIRYRWAVVGCKSEPPQRAIPKKLSESTIEDSPIGLSSDQR